MDKVAAALNVANGPMFQGGAPYSDPGPKVHIGYVDHPSPGRKDQLRIQVPAGSYVVPADVVSALGQGNSIAGGKLLEQMFRAAPYGATVKRAQGGGIGAPRDIMISGGEYVIPPDAVQAKGKGDIDRGHGMLDRWVKAERAKLIRTLSKLPGPKND